MQVTFSGIGGRTALVPQKNGVRAPSWAFNSNLKFTCKMSLDAMQDVRITETPITRALTWEDEQAPASMGNNNMQYTSNATAALIGIPAPSITLKTCNGAPGQFKNGFYFTVHSETHGKCLLLAYLHLGGLLVRPSVKSFNKNNAVLVHTEMCAYDTHSVSVDIKIPETSSIHKAGPRYSSTHPPFSIKFIIWGPDGLIKNMHESMPLYSYAKDPDQVNCQWFSPNPNAPQSSPSSTPRGDRGGQNMHRNMHESASPPPSPPQLTSTALTPTTPTSPNSVSPLASLSSTFTMGSAAAAISIPMDSFKSLVAYIQKLERQVEMQQQQLESARQQEELQHRLISQLAQDIKFKSFQCEVLEEKMQQLSSPHTSQQQTPTGDNLIAPPNLLNLSSVMNSNTPTNPNHLSPFAYPSTPTSASSSSPHLSTINNPLPSFQFSAPMTGLTPIPQPPITSSPALTLSTPLIISNPLTANLSTNGENGKPLENMSTTTTNGGPVSSSGDATTDKGSDSATNSNLSDANGSESNGVADKEGAQSEEEVRDFLTQMQKKQKQETADEADRKRVRN